MSTYQSQKAAKPTPEDMAVEILDAERAAAMLNLVDFIRANKIGIQWASSNSWTLRYKAKVLGSLKIYTGIKNVPARPDLHGTWFFCHHRDYLDHYYGMEDSDLKTFIFDNIYARNCGNCICTSIDPNEEKAGYMNPTGCGCWPLRVYNPAGETLENTKRLIEFRMNCILEDGKKAM